MNNTVYDCTLIELPKIHNNAGNITAINNGKRTIPFTIKRSYYIYDIPGGASRGAHAHKALEQLMVAASGSFDISLDDGNTKRTYSLNRPYHGLYIPSGLWGEIDNFSSGAICLVLASHKFDEYDYVRNYQEFIEFKNAK